MSSTNLQKSLKILRVRYDKSQADIAEYMGITQANYSRIESGKQKITLEDLEKIIKCCNCRLIDFLSIYEAGQENE